jgi:hypothetical protein
MTTTEHGCHHQPWEHFGRAAERFARRVADDAKLFAERVEEHVGDLARDVRREWREARPRDAASSDDVRRIFDDVRGIVRGVLDGVDELLSGLFREEGEAGWSKVVLNRDATCAACGKGLATGTEAFVRRDARGMQARCAECGPPAD